MSSIDLEADEISRLHAKSANMTVFHMAYKLLCAYSVAGARDFLDDVVDLDLDPATPENGNKNIRERYDAWVARTGAVRPHAGDRYTEEDWDELRKRSDAI